MSEYIITIKQLATVIAKCHGLIPENADGTPICNQREIAELIDEPITLKEIVRCRCCKFFATDSLGDYCTLLDFEDVKPMGGMFCAWGERA